MSYKIKLDDDLDYYETGSPVYTADEKIRITSADTTSDFLNNKLIAGSNIILSVSGAGGDERLIIDSSGGGVSLVDSVFSRTGDVVATQDDYTWAQIDKTTSDIIDITTRNHSGLSNVGSYAHPVIDSHIDDTSIHFTDGSIVHTYNNENISGIKIFNQFPQCTQVPSSGLQLVNKTYVDAFAQGLTPKAAVRVATTTNIDISGEQIIDTINVVSGNRVLVKDQTDSITNGIYNCLSGPGTIWTRSTDYDEDAEVTAGTYTIVLEGNANDNTQWVQYNINPKVGGSAINFRMLPQIEVYTASQGVKKVDYDFQSLLTYSGISLFNGSLFTPTDNSTIGLTNGSLYVRPSGITNTELIGSININKIQYGTPNEIVATNTAGSSLQFKTLVAGDNMTITNAGSTVTFASTGGAGSATSDYIYMTEILHSHPASSFTWTNMPSGGIPEASSYFRRKVNLTGAQEYRLVVNQAVAGATNAKLRTRYSTDNATYLDIGNESNIGDLAVGAGTGVKVGAWEDLVAGAKQDVWISLFGYSGDQVADPQWRQMEVQFKVNSSIQDIGSSSVMTKECVFHSHPASALAWTNMPSGGITEFLSNVYHRKKVDLTGTTQFRIGVNQSVAGYTTSVLDAQYSLNNSTYYQLASTSGAGELNVGSGLGVKYGAWANIVGGAQQDAWIRLVGMSGNQVADPAWRQVWLEFKQFINVSGLISNDVYNTPLEDSSGSIYLRYDSNFTNTNGSLVLTNNYLTNVTGSVPIEIIGSNNVNLRYETGLALNNGSLIINGSQINHLQLQNIGTNTHAVIDTHIENNRIHALDGGSRGQMYFLSGAPASGSNIITNLYLGASGTTLRSDGTYPLWDAIAGTPGGSSYAFNSPLENDGTGSVYLRYTTNLALTNGSLNILDSVWQPSGAYQISGLYYNTTTTPLEEVNGSGIVLRWDTGLTLSNGSLIVNTEALDHAALTNLNWDVAEHVINTNLNPDTNGARDIGSPLYWKNIYFTGSLSDGTNAVTPQQIGSHFNNNLRHTPGSQNYGDIYFCSGIQITATKEVVSLGIGASGTVLKSNGGFPDWGTVVGGTGSIYTFIVPLENNIVGGEEGSIYLRYTTTLVLLNGSLAVSGTWQPSGLYAPSGAYQPSGLYQASGLYQPSGVYHNNVSQPLAEVNESGVAFRYETGLTLSNGSLIVNGSQISHTQLLNLSGTSSNPHPQYWLTYGIAGNQTYYGGTARDNNLDIYASRTDTGDGNGGMANLRGNNAQGNDGLNGYNGGDANLYAGVGTDGAPNGNGGNGGNNGIIAGQGGNGTALNGNGGFGGTLNFLAGGGGNGATLIGQGGQGGNTTISAGIGGRADNLGTGGQGGELVLQPGNGGDSLNGTGGNGANLNLNAGTGGNGAGGNGLNGEIIFNAQGNALRPVQDLGDDIGKTNRRVKHLFVGGSFSDGTDYYTLNELAASGTGLSSISGNYPIKIVNGSHVSLLYSNNFNLANGSVLTPNFIPGLSNSKAWLSGTAQLAITGKTIIPFNVELWDTNSEMVGSRFTAKSNGFYQVNSQFNFDVDGANHTFIVTLERDGAILELFNFVPCWTDDLGYNISTLVYCGSNSYLELFGETTGGTNTFLENDNASKSFWSVFKICGSPY